MPETKFFRRILHLLVVAVLIIASFSICGAEEVEHKKALLMGEPEQKTISALQPILNMTWGESTWDDRGYSIAVDSSNIYVAGRKTNFDQGYEEVFVLKCDLNGNRIWDTTWSGHNYEGAKSIAIDSSNIYVAGYTNSYGAGLHDAFILKYDLKGNLLWNKTWGGYGDDFGASIAIDSSNIYVVGETESYGAGGYDSFLLKYDLNGNLIWYKTWGGSNNDMAESIAVLSSNIYVVGETKSYGVGAADAFVLKYDLNGNIFWCKTWGGGKYETAYSIAVFSSNIYVTGYTLSFGAGGEGAFILKCNLEGGGGAVKAPQTDKGKIIPGFSIEVALISICIASSIVLTRMNQKVWFIRQRKGHHTGTCQKKL